MPPIVTPLSATAQEAVNRLTQQAQQEIRALSDPTQQSPAPPSDSTQTEIAALAPEIRTEIKDQFTAAAQMRASAVPISAHPKLIAVSKNLSAVVVIAWKVVSLGVIVGFAYFVWYVLNHLEKILPIVQATEAARGFITMLIAVTTVSIALLLALFAIAGDSADVKERFDFGKQVLSVLVGILGTIVGFYFGTGVAPKVDVLASQSGLPGQVLQVAARVVGSPVAVGGTVTVSGSVNGGTPPYSVSFGFSPDIKLDKTIAVPDNKPFSQPFAVPAGSTGLVKLKVSATDAARSVVSFDNNGSLGFTIQ